MSQRGVTIEVEASPRALRAAWRLAAHRELNAVVRLLRQSGEAPREGVLRIEKGSIVRPLLTLLWGETQNQREGDSDRDRYAAIGLNSAVWTVSGEDEMWRRTAAPLPRWIRYGTPDSKRPWVLIAPGADANEARLERLTGLSDPQAHFVLPRAASGHRNPVWWLPRRAVLESLLGHVDAVIAPSGPFAWDAIRSGVPVFDDGTRRGIPETLARRRLASVVPDVLARDADFWRAIAAQLLGGPGQDWGTLPWLAIARERARRRPSSARGGLRLKRKLLKLRRDPARFWADSVLAKRFARPPRHET